jgi:hypothetical protein
MKQISLDVHASVRLQTALGSRYRWSRCVDRISVTFEHAHRATYEREKRRH